MWKNVKWGPTLNSTEITLQARGMDLIDCLSFLFQLSFSTLGKVSIYLDSSQKSMNKYRYNSCSSMSWCICYILCLINRTIQQSLWMKVNKDFYNIWENLDLYIKGRSVSVKDSNSFSIFISPELIFEGCLLSVVFFVLVVVNFSPFHLFLQNHVANFNQTLHRASVGEGNSSFF